MSEAIGTLIIELQDATFIALAEDVQTFSSGAGASSSDAHDLDTLLGSHAETTAATRVVIARPRGAVTFTCSGRPRFSTTSTSAFYRLPKMIAGTCAGWVRGIHVENEKISVWIDLARLADAVRGA